MGFAHILPHGQKGTNGVAILSRQPFAQEETRIWCGRDDRRHAGVRLASGVEIHNFYVPSGGDVPDPARNDKFDHKLRFLGEMIEWAADAALRERPVVLVGDLNIAPLARDTWNHKRHLRSVGHTPRESALMAELRAAAALIDAPRRFVPDDAPLYTWWGYRYREAFAKNYGWRLDHIFVTPPLGGALGACRVVAQTRGWDQPSDHAPVVVDL